MDNEVSSSLDTVTIGDLIILKAESLANVSGGYLRGDGAGFNLGVQLPSTTNNEQNITRDSLQFEDYVFRICPALTYRQKNELEAVLKRSSVTNTGIKRIKSKGTRD